MNAAQLDQENDRWVQTWPTKEYYTVQECSHILDVGGPTVYSAIRRGSIKAVRINGTTHVAHEALIEYIDKRNEAHGSTDFDISNAVIEEIKPEEDAKRKAVEMTEAVEKERSKPEPEQESQKKSPLDFLDE